MQTQPTIRWMGHDPATLSPGSHEKVWDICAGCEMAILRERRYVGRLCRRCVRKGIPRPRDVCEKISIGLTGRAKTPEHREALRIAATKRLANPENHPMYGRKHTPESIEKMHIAHSNRSEETLKLMSDVQKGIQSGEKNGFYGKTHSKSISPIDVIN